MRGRGRVVGLVVLSLALALPLSGQAVAEPAGPVDAPRFTDDPDADAARRHYDLGLKAYDRAAFVEAIREFELAKSLKAAPAFDYNIGRCFERLEEWQRAADAYMRFLVASPRTDGTAALTARIEVLRARAQVSGDQSASAALDLARTRRRARIAGWSLAGATLALAAAGTGAYLSPLGDYRDAQADCRAGCPHETLGGLRTQVHRAEIAGAVLWGAAGAALVADVVLWTLAARKRAPSPPR